MAKKIVTTAKLQLPAGKATPGPPVGSTLGPHGINIAGFVKDFNDKTRDKEGLVIPEITKHLSNTTVGANCVRPRETAGLPYG